MVQFGRGWIDTDCLNELNRGSGLRGNKVELKEDELKPLPNLTTLRMC